MKSREKTNKQKNKNRNEQTKLLVVKEWKMVNFNVGETNAKMK